MKKAIVLSLMLGSSIVMLPSFEVRAAAPSMSAGEPQIIVQTRRQRRDRRWNNRRVRTVTTTRVRWVAGRRIRETIRTTYLPNGTTRTQVIRRVRL
jgi:hypothetical protein